MDVSLCNCLGTAPRGNWLCRTRTHLPVGAAPWRLGGPLSLLSLPCLGTSFCCLAPSLCCLFLASSLLRCFSQALFRLSLRVSMMIADMLLLYRVAWPRV